MLRDSLRLAAVFCLTALIAGALAPRPVPAQVTTERGASILVFPKVIADASADTVIQLANLSDNSIDAYCTYVDGSSARWQSLGFRVGLGPRRPLYWSAARGRTSGAGADPSDVPAAPAAFRGELLCVQVDGSGAPFSGNELAGQATLTDLTSGDVAAYTAAGLRSSGFNDQDEFLCIGNQTSDHCVIGEYDPCPAEWSLSFPADGAEDEQLGPGSRRSTRLAVAPCSQNLGDQTPGTVDIELTVFNEMAQQFSGAASVTCWADLSLTDIADHIFTRGVLGTDYGEATLRPAGGSGGFMLVAQTTRSTGGAVPVASSVAINLHHQGGADASDLLVLPVSRP